MPDNLLIASGPGRPKDLAKRQAILDAAKNLFVSNGYAGTSMDAVAAEAGVSKLTVYNHFTDKETLFSAAVVARCEEQLPELFFEMPEGTPVETVLTTIGRGFHALINSRDSIELHRLMVALGAQDPKLSQIFFEAGPERILQEMERLLIQIDNSGSLNIDKPRLAAEHFLCLLKGTCNFRLLIGCNDAPNEGADDEHVREVVSVFMRAYRA
ncbi:TetR/AcrR family transcriptional regulator [Pseudomonas sp. CCI3.2]|uniref:TetR/AcrR family transcriptional regulator n=1 Tax=unclassified Pseudomonas TaxID=196821 RepID=UPI002AC9624E|nr:MULTISPECIES: TetR/AcrR family transcriptional regulator [unclassified Pseudomonas]MEB0077052.1 TetR/AcrR family transcriptional regulator [Pseudomonas sp. MH10out]MEB0089854.1 TetR/AcrR family transcriptional regulator [Pseudomonas sp. CCI4.2]MEB0102726.1 TetR/AcrR family transcriptional regulator [Pseudomonas sp. CCI3.2]MEB0129143.1 TetR/AcrR family transcriptional regulator [Pseudomonas sp. CCI2.4]MEB0156330.1 TetR/AcrR family transcriptional regulator [Pseudomonas sp. AH2 (2023)]